MELIRLKALVSKIKDWKEDSTLNRLIQENRKHFTIPSENKVVVVHLDMKRILLSRAKDVHYLVGYGNPNDLDAVSDLVRYSVRNGREWDLDPSLFYVNQYFLGLRLESKYLFSSSDELKAEDFAHRRAVYLANRISEMNHNNHVVDTSRDPDEILKDVENTMLYSNNPVRDICEMKH
ncbi:hypothetical protein J4477_00345 [Candidatus Pacearchaeota archaeon]|nr:hypothetical protein [Candidatus Pacearchaeota archaeon]